MLGAFLGFTPGFDHAPGLILFWAFLLLILNANLFVAGLIGLISKLIYLLTLPIAFSICRILLEGPTQGLFRALHNGPVTAYFGLDYYAVVGGQFIALIVGIGFGYLFSKGLQNYRQKMSDWQSTNEKPTGSKKPWVKILNGYLSGRKVGKAMRN
jgi:uncharacterized protein (TIGR03546 family)